uniref:Uncharacterized protein n=1 Tax=Oryza barthii TaxID=65489 RepID=A0A0D3FAM9_9ORYZ
MADSELGFPLYSHSFVSELRVSRCYAEMVQVEIGCGVRAVPSNKFDPADQQFIPFLIAFYASNV